MGKCNKEQKSVHIEYNPFFPYSTERDPFLLLVAILYAESSFTFNLSVEGKKTLILPVLNKYSSTLLGRSSIVF